MNKLSKTTKQIKRKIIFNIMRQWMIYVVVLVILVYICIFFCDSRIWQGDDPVYRILRVIQYHLITIFLIFTIIGCTYIFIHNMNKVFYYLEAIMQSYDFINDDDNELIELPYNELKEYETKINHFKLQLTNNKRIAKEAEQRKNDLVVYLAHDLKTPLTSIIGYISLLKDEPQISNQTREHYLSVVLNKALRLEELINEFFEITRFNLTHQVLEYSNVNLTRLLEQLTYEFKPMFKDKNLTCTLNIDKDFMLNCDVNKMQRVLDNLLRNAVNYSFVNSEIRIDVNKDDKIHITFTNHGNTIPKEKLERIFDQFYRIDNSRTSSTGGAGLGLAIAKEIIEQHQGSIEAISENEQIIFKITLPS